MLGAGIFMHSSLAGVKEGFERVLYPKMHEWFPQGVAGEVLAGMGGSSRVFGLRG